MIPPTTSTRRRSMRRQFSSAAFLLLFGSATMLVGAPLTRTVSGQPGAGSALFDMAEWRLRTPDDPVAGHVAIMDDVRGRIVVMGGETAPFEPTTSSRQLALDGSWAWSPLVSTGTAPASALVGRGILGARAILDPEESAVYMLCHCAEVSVHRLDLASNTWSVASADTTKSIVHGLMAYDPIGDRALVFGGDPHDVGLVTTAAWALDLSPAATGWSPLPDTPFGLIFQGADTDPVSGNFLAFGGQTEDGELSSELWRLDVSAVDGDSAWRRVPSAADTFSPSRRIGATLTFIGDSSQAVLYGGYSADGFELSDVWHLDYSTPDRARWTPIDAPGVNPGARAGHTASWDEANRDLIVFGGASTEDEIRYLGLTNVLDLDPSPEPTPSIETPSPSPTSVEPTPTVPTPGTEDRSTIYLPLVLNTHIIN